MPGKIYTFSMDLDGSVLLECKSHSQIKKYSFLGGEGVSYIQTSMAIKFT